MKILFLTFSFLATSIYAMDNRETNDLVVLEERIERALIGDSNHYLDTCDALEDARQNNIVISTEILENALSRIVRHRFSPYNRFHEDETEIMCILAYAKAQNVSLRVDLLKRLLILCQEENLLSLFFCIESYVRDNNIRLDLRRYLPSTSRTARYNPLVYYHSADNYGRRPGTHSDTHRPNVHSASSLSPGSSKLMKDLRHKLKAMGVKVLTPKAAKESAHLFLENYLKKDTYLLEILKNYADTNLSDELSQEVISYAKHLKDRAENKSIDLLIFKHLIENCFANTVNNWDIKEQEALEQWLISLPSEGLKTSVNPFLISCAPGQESRTLQLFGRLSEIENFSMEKIEANYTERVILQCREVLEKVFDICLFLLGKKEIHTLEELEKSANHYLNSLMPQENREVLIFSCQSLEEQVLKQIQTILGERNDSLCCAVM